MVSPAAAMAGPRLRAAASGSLRSGLCMRHLWADPAIAARGLAAVNGPARPPCAGRDVDMPAASRDHHALGTRGNVRTRRQRWTMSKSPLELRSLGRTAVKTSALGFGGAPIGGFRYTLSEQQGADTGRAAYAAGLRYFDPSPYYGYGRSELLFGQALRDHPRDSFVLSTKVGRWMAPLAAGETVPGWRPGGLAFKPTFDYSRDGTLRSMEQ